MPSSVKFIVGKNKNGIIIEASCDPKKMFFYKNKACLAKPDPFLTKVVFKKEVLDKYYLSSEIYSVGDGVLWGENHSWYIPMDNNHETHIMVYLGDLYNLPHDEQYHWRSCNIFEEFSRMSNVAIDRNFYCEFRNPDSLDLLVKEKLRLFNKNFEAENGWQLFRDLNSYDDHNLKSLTILSIGNQRQFDEGILRLAIIFVDSINVEEINNIINFSDEEKKQGGLYKLKKYITTIKKITHAEELIEILKLIQKLRSCGSAHRKSSKYSELLKDVPGKSLQYKYSHILKKLISALTSFFRLKN